MSDTLPVSIRKVEFVEAPEDVAAKARCLFLGLVFLKTSLTLRFAKFVIEQKVATPEGLKDFKSQAP